MAHSVPALVHCFSPPVYINPCMKRCGKELSEVSYAEALASRFANLGVRWYAHIHVLGASAPAPVKVRSIPSRKKTVRRRSTKKKRDEPSEWYDESGYGMNGPWGGGDSGKGWNFGSESWNDEEWRWGTVFYVMYHISCFLSLFQCVYYAVNRVARLIEHGKQNAAPIARCSTVYLQKDVAVAPLVLENCGFFFKAERFSAPIFCDGNLRLTLAETLAS
eukprot:Gb_21385 [translate_table: standard]